jgi:SSS family transporter
MTHLSPLDIAIIIVYIVGTTALGAWFTGRQRDLKSYFVGDRNVGWLLVLISIVATETSTVTFLSVPGVAFNPNGGNLTFLQLAFGYVIGRTFIAWLLLPQYFRGEWFSAYEVLRQRFNPVVQRTASALFLGTRTVADGLRLYLTALLMNQFTGWDMTASVLVISVVTLIYTYLGGMHAVIWTDLIQFILKILGAVVSFIVLLNLLPGGWNAFVAVGSQAGKFTVIDLSTDITKPYTLWAGILGGAFLTMASHGADQLMVQRYLCSRTLSQARLAVVLSGVVVLAQFLLFLLLGVGLYVYQQAGGLPDGLRQDQAFGAFIVSALPVGVIGIVIAAVLAAAMSTLSASLNSSATALMTDFYKPLRPGRSEAEYLSLSKTMTIFWGMAQVGVALLATALTPADSIVNLVLRIAGLTTGIILGLFFLGRMQSPVSSRAAILGLLCGVAAVLACWLPELWRPPVLAWPWFAPIGTLVTFTSALVADRLLPISTKSRPV